MTADVSQERSLSREELYQRVWSIPMSKLAPRFGLSDVGLKKLCKRHNVPTPGVGYRAKKEFGKAGRPTPLPAETDPLLQVVQLTYNPAPKPHEKPTPPPFPVKTPELRALVEREREPKFRITVADNLRSPHSVVVRMRDEFTAGRR